MKKHIYLAAILTLIFSSCSTKEPTGFDTLKETKNTYTLKVSVTPIEAGKITISPQSPIYKEGDVITLTPEPNEQWKFEKWQGDVSGNSNALQIIMNTNTSVIGVFLKAQNYSVGSVFGTSGPTVIVEVTNPKTGKTWMDRNLGASRAATSSTDVESYGDLYQWGRGADGHQLRNSATTTRQSSTDEPGNGSFITRDFNSLQDWRSPKNNNLWKGVNGINNPCPKGFRLPTRAELEEEMESWSPKDTEGALNSPLKLPMAGERSASGSLRHAGTFGHYWNSTDSYQLRFFSDNFLWSGTGRMHFTARAYGGSIRCIKD